MKKILALLMGSLCLLLSENSLAQSAWTETDRKYLLDNLRRSSNELVRETENLTEAQWNFKESPDRWSIRQVAEHINIWELLMTHEITRAIAAGPQPGLNAKVQPDSVYSGFILEEKAHITTDYTKPFTYTVPMGLIEGKASLAWFRKMRDESVQFIDTTKADLRSHYAYAGRPNIHQRYITLSGHTERHVRQIRKVKEHPNYPR